MKELLLNNGWVHYKTGCSCNGSPKFYNHPAYFGYIVITKSVRFAIKKDGKVIASGNADQLKQKLIDNEIYTEAKNVEP
ncbi:MAG: hypothetical protein LBQ74_12935 [Prevotella sp.]|jgi:hypothetical protein|nr:hypothetical protein [Prevotella sp.]